MTSEHDVGPEVGADTQAYGTGDASYRAAGGEAGIRRWVDDFYDEMQVRPAARGILEMHPPDLTISRDKLTRFLCGWLGGPKLFRERYGVIHLPRAHAHLTVGATERDAWLECMQVAVERQPFEEGFKRYVLRQLAVPAERVRQVCAEAQQKPGDELPLTR